MRSLRPLRAGLPAALVASLLLALPAHAVPALDEYVLSGSMDGSGTFDVDDDLDVYLNGTLIFTENLPAGTPRAHQPIRFTAQVGATLRFVVRDSYGQCTVLTRVFITDAFGRAAVAEPGFAEICGFPPGDRGVVYDRTFQIPQLADPLPVTQTALPGSTQAGVVPGRDGQLYGVTYDGGLDDKGTIFRFDPWSATVTTLHSFDGTDGETPYSELVPDPATGKLYGTTDGGGLTGLGTIFEYDPTTSAFRTIKSDFTTAAHAPRGMVLVDGFLYGVLFYASGSVFRIAPSGSDFAVIHTFADASSLPQTLVLGPPTAPAPYVRQLYGVTTHGGVVCRIPFPQTCGTIFRLNPVAPGDVNTDFETLYQFQSLTNLNRTNFPQGNVVLADGSLYGTTFFNVFRLDAGNALDFVFTGGAGTSISVAGGADQRLYLADYEGGPGFGGRVLSINRDGSLARTHLELSFTEGTKAYGPYGRLYRNALGTVFGTTEYTVDPPEHGVVFAIARTGPVATAQAVTTSVATPVGITLAGSDPGGNPLTFAVVTNPQHGTVTGVAPNLTYAPAGGYVGTDSFTFAAVNAFEISLPVTVSIDVQPVGSTIGAAGGTFGLPDGSVTVTVPPGAVAGPTDFTITSAPSSTYGVGTPASLVKVVSLAPSGLVFAVPVEIEFRWPDAAPQNGIVDGLGVAESTLRLFRNGVAITGQCSEAAHQPATCTTACCDPTANTWTMAVATFSEYALDAAPCASFEKPKLTLGKLLAPAGDDTLTFTGSLVAPVAAPDPDVHGLTITIDDANGIFSQVTIPAGAYDKVTKTGWKVNKKRTAWTWLHPKDGAPGGLVKASIVLRKGRLVVGVKGNVGSYAATPPVAFALVLPGNGVCARADFATPGLACELKSKGKTLLCDSMRVR